MRVPGKCYISAVLWSFHYYTHLISFAVTRRPQPERGGHGSVRLHRREVIAVEGDVQLPEAAAQEPLPLRHVCLSHQRGWSLWWCSGTSSLCSFFFPPVNAAVTLRCAGRNVFDISMLKNTWRKALYCSGHSVFCWSPSRRLCQVQAYISCHIYLSLQATLEPNVMSLHRKYSESLLLASWLLDVDVGYKLSSKIVVCALSKGKKKTATCFLFSVWEQRCCARSSGLRLHVSQWCSGKLKFQADGMNNNNKKLNVNRAFPKALLNPLFIETTVALVVVGYMCSHSCPGANWQKRGNQ